MIDQTYTIEELADGTWTVWFPDINGAKIGEGKTRHEAIGNAVVNLQWMKSRLMKGVSCN